jgi:polyhydroxyalkanoate synthesis regulator phasin
MREVSQIEVYEVLKGKIGEQEAKLLIEYIEIRKKEIATKEDIMRLEEIIKMVEKSTKEDIQRLEKDIQRIENEINDLKKKAKEKPLLDFGHSYNSVGNYYCRNYYFVFKN